jgi:hypothetical protein
MISLTNTISQAREVRPTTPRQVWLWVHRFTGIQISTRAVCAGHVAPFTPFARQFLNPPRLALWHGPRGSGKSFLSAIETHMSSRFTPRLGTRILGGSLAQSGQIYQGLTEGVRDGHGPLGSDADTFLRLGAQKTLYTNGANVQMLAASPTSVRGPHVARLKLDEVDEIKPDIREDAFGTCMAVRGVAPSVLMTSTWHRVAGPMADLLAKSQAGVFPSYTYCVFEVLETCPTDRSGPDLENCPSCPLQKWCHSDLGVHPSGLPKAKRSTGHYTIESLIQKVQGVSSRVFESDYLCLRPKVSGTWFTMFDEVKHVTELAVYDPRYPVHVAVDSGVHCGAVWFQVLPPTGGSSHNIRVIGDYYREGVSAESNAQAIKARTHELCGLAPWKLRVSHDPAGDSRTPMGYTVRSEFERAGLVGHNGRLDSWGPAKKQEGLQLVEALLESADLKISLFIHPRCTHLIRAFQGYARAMVDNQLMDYEKDPQHPFEELIDPLCGGLKLEFPQGRETASPAITFVHGGRLH